MECCVCNKVTDYGLPGEMMFIIGSGTYWYACEGIWQDGNQTIRQAVFRTQENFWEKDKHSWETNYDRHKQPTAQYTHGKWMTGSWQGELKCGLAEVI